MTKYCIRCDMFAAKNLWLRSLKNSGYVYLISSNANKYSQ